MTSDDWTIDSPRLHLRPFTPGDADEAFAGITPGLTRYMAFEPPPSEAAFAAVWQTWLPTIADGTDITFAIRLWSAASERLRCAAFRYPVAERNRSSRSLAESLGGQAVAREQGVKYTAIVYRIPAAMHGVATDVAESR